MTPSGNRHDGTAEPSGKAPYPAESDPVLDEPWVLVKRLAGLTMHVLEMGYPFWVQDVTDHMIRIRAQRFVGERAIKRSVVIEAWRHLFFEKEIDRAKIMYWYSKNNPGYLAAVLATLPGVTYTLHPIRLFFDPPPRFGSNAPIVTRLLDPSSTWTSVRVPRSALSMPAQAPKHRHQIVRVHYGPSAILTLSDLEYGSSRDELDPDVALPLCRSIQDWLRQSMTAACHMELSPMVDAEGDCMGFLVTVRSPAQSPQRKVGGLSSDCSSSS